jgi:glutathione synthase/RimK-type ligase-like ATP-grasp enzyme
MIKKSVGMAFSRKLTGSDPLGHIGVKKPVYMRFFELCKKEGWNLYVLTRKTYKGNGIFEGGWKYDEKKFVLDRSSIKIDLVYDRSAGVKFPPKNDTSTIWVNEHSFKTLAWDKWAAYQGIGKYMPQTLLVEDESMLSKILPKINTDWVVLKPFNGLKGIGIFIGPKADAEDFTFNKKYRPYIAQEFVDTSGGIEGVTSGRHDLRIVIINGKVVWSHIRTPVGESFLANAAQGGNLVEIDYSKVPLSVKGVVENVSELFSEKYDSPIYSLDFGIDREGEPRIFEINDQIGFPQWDMKNRDKFLFSLIENFKGKLSAH